MRNLSAAYKRYKIPFRRLPASLLVTDAHRPTKVAGNPHYEGRRKHGGKASSPPYHYEGDAPRNLTFTRIITEVELGIHGKYLYVKSNVVDSAIQYPHADRDAHPLQKKSQRKKQEENDSGFRKRDIYRKKEEG